MALPKIGLAKDVREQKLGEGQELGGALLDAEARLGELLPPDKYTITSIEGSNRPQKIKSLPEGISHKLSHQCQQLAEHPALIEQVIAEVGDSIKAIPIDKSYTGFQRRKSVLPEGITHKLSHYCQQLNKSYTGYGRREPVLPT